MGRIQNFFRGVTFAAEGIQEFYKSPQLWKYAVFPLLMILLTYAGLIVAGTFIISGLSAYFAEKCADLPGYLQWLSAVASGASAIAMTFLLSVIAVASLGTLYELFGGLFFDALIERYASDLTPPPVKLDWRFNLSCIKESVIYSINTLLIIIAASILNLFLPFIGQLICVVIISYRFGVTYMAVSGFHYRQTLMQTRERAYRNFALTLGYGLTIYVIFLIPLAIVFTLPGLIIGGILILSEFLRNER